MLTFVFVFLSIAIFVSDGSPLCGLTSLTSIDNSTWELADEIGTRFTARDAHAAVNYNGQIWITGGHVATHKTKHLIDSNAASDVWNSYDGKTWTRLLDEAPWRRRYGHTLSVFTPTGGSNVMVLLGGYTPLPANDIWTSNNGKDWTNVQTITPFSFRAMHCTAVYNNRLWVMGGTPLNNEVWSSSDLQNWVKQENTPWSPRLALGCTEHTVINATVNGSLIQKSYLYIAGGWDGYSLNDVWRMDSNGVWEIVTESAPWTPRAWHSLISVQSMSHYDFIQGPRLWVLGGGVVGRGVLKMIGYDDVWFTRDGANWTAASSDVTGLSTAKWCMMNYKGSMKCLGKYGQAVVPFQRNVTTMYHCQDCRDAETNVSLSGQVIPLCPGSNKPDSSYLAKITNSVTKVTRQKYVFPDTCGTCTGNRSQHTTTAISLLFVGGFGSLAQSSKDVYIAREHFFCEKEGQICSGVGICAVGGTCMCPSGLKGQFCDEIDDEIVYPQTRTCFPPDAIVLDSSGNQRKITDIKIGDYITSYDEESQAIVSSQVFYIPHNIPDEEAVYYRVHLEEESLVLEVTGDHLLYVSDSESGSFYQIAAKSLTIGKQCLVTVKGSLHRRKIHHVELIKRRGLYNLYTTSGNMFVNGILCSTYGDFYPFTIGGVSLPHLYFLPHRLLLSLFPISVYYFSYFQSIDQKVIAVLLDLCFGKRT